MILVSKGRRRKMYKLVNFYEIALKMFFGNYIQNNSTVSCRKAG